MPVNATMIEVKKQRQGIQSVEVGAQLLQTLTANGRPMMLRDLAKNSGMPAAKAHRYLVSFMRIGLVEQDARTGRYDLGEFSLELGLASFARIDPIRLADPVLEGLCDEIGETVTFAIWGKNGATCVRSFEVCGPVTFAMRIGAVLPLTSSATGLAFAAFYNPAALKKSLDAELRITADASNTTPTAAMRALENKLRDIRKHGIARASGGLVSGINGFSAPVFDRTGRMVAAITSGGTTDHFDMEWDSAPARSIKASAAILSKQLGYGHADMSSNKALPPAG